MGATINDLNKQLHDQLTRLNSDITGKDLEMEIERAKAMSQIGTVIVNNNKSALEAMKLVEKGLIVMDDTKRLLGS